MLDEMLAKLVEFLQEASPLVWDALVRQVYMQAIVDTIWAIALGIACVLLFRVAGKCRAHMSEIADSLDRFDWVIGAVFSYMGATGTGFGAVACITTALMHFANPTYYAITLIVGQIK